MKASDFIAQFLQRQGVTHVFEMSGGMITHMLDSFHRAGSPKVVSVHHEQTAAFAADAMGRMTGIPGVALATSGPGATNLLTGIGSSYFDSSPAVFITGQVNRHEQKGSRAVRQLGFQETDIVSMALPITKAAWQVNDPARLPEMLESAFRLATSGRPGPVLLDIPMDVQRADIVAPAVPAGPTSESASAVRPYLEQLLVDLGKAKRPLILAGGGVRSARAIEAFRRLAEVLRLPVVHSLMGVDLLPFCDPLNFGMIGSYGNRWANLALGQSDFVLVLGSRLDIRQTGADVDGFKGNRVFYHIDCEPGELNNRIVGCRTLTAHLHDFLEPAAQHLHGRIMPDHAPWFAQISQLREQWPDTRELKDVTGINPNTLMHQLSRRSAAAIAYAVDVGQHQMWAAQSLELNADQRFLTSGGMGSMGFALPAAIGATIAMDRRPVVLIAGDGGFQANIQELQTVARNQLPLKMVVINNRCHGMVRQFQESYFEGRYQSTVWGYSAPDFQRVSEAYGVPGLTVSDPGRLDEAIQWLWNTPQTPALLQVMVESQTNVYPKIAFGKPMTEMEPYAQPVEMEGT